MAIAVHREEVFNRIVAEGRAIGSSQFTGGSRRRSG
jgi:sRNA-binding carbon storage regulator CsrA